MSRRTVPVRLMNLTGMYEGMAEREVGFLDQLLPLFQLTDGVPRADVEVVRVGSLPRFLDYLFYGDVDLIHLSSHGSARKMQIGDVKRLTPTTLRKEAKEREPIGAVVVNTSCQMATDKWVDSFLDAGATAYIATKRAAWTKDAAIFAACFYSAYFGTTHQKKTSAQRAFDAYRLASAAYASFVPLSSRANFYFRTNEKVVGRRKLAVPSLEQVR